MVLLSKQPNEKVRVFFFRLFGSFTLNQITLYVQNSFGGVQRYKEWVIECIYLCDPALFLIPPCVPTSSSGNTQQENSSYKSWMKIYEVCSPLFWDLTFVYKNKIEVGLLEILICVSWAAPQTQPQHWFLRMTGLLSPRLKIYCVSKQMQPFVFMSWKWSLPKVYKSNGTDLPCNIKNVH